jgi:hypothetical protein
MTMTRCALAMLLLAGAPAAWAQQGTASLQCDGKYSNFLRGVRDVEQRGGYVEVRQDSVKVAGIPGFEATYKVSTKGDKAICFAHPTDKLFQGCINRFSGQLSLSKLSARPRPGDHGKLDLLWYGNCRTARPLF